jgi:hypothetical protein
MAAVVENLLPAIPATSSLEENQLPKSVVSA